MKRLIASVLVLMLLATANLATAATMTKVLEKDSWLHPIGWGADSLIFKGRTSVTVNEFGEVLSGTLAHYEYLTPTVGYASNGDTSGAISFRQGTVVVFNEKGEVIEGVLGRNAWIKNMDKKGYFELASNTYVKFNPATRVVEEGTLFSQPYLRPHGWKNNIKSGDLTAGFLKFQHGTVTKFNSQGEVISGTLAEAAKLRTTDGKVRNFEPNTAVKFNENGEVEVP